MSIIEAMALGKPILGAQIGGIPEMIEEGATGFTHKPRNVRDLREKLRVVAEADKHRIKSMGQASRRFVEQYHSAEAHYENLMKVYQNPLLREKQ